MKRKRVKITLVVSVPDDDTNDEQDIGREIITVTRPELVDGWRIKLDSVGTFKGGSE